ncbi:MAG: exopolysaccharide biosynthesis protein [Bacteroidales bacterium]|nr:exopolysaccharide biosynthesis protein [Bacteroidales bacterium]
MDILSQIIRMLYRIRYWLIILPILTTLIAIFQTRNLERTYEVNTTIYTGIASGFTIESGLEGSTRVDWNSVSNGMDNIISIIRSKATLRQVSMRLYVQHMIHGDSLRDNNYIKAENYRGILRITPKEVRALIDKDSEENTIRNLYEYEKASPTNFVYGLFNWYHPYYSYNALSKIDVRRIFNSDMLEINYAANDPGVAYNTLVLLTEEFVNQYEFLRFGETNNVVEYFRRELAALAQKLRVSEDSLTQYYIEKKVINYPEQTKQIAALAKDYDLLYNEVLLKYTSSTTMVADLEEKIKEHTKMIENNALFVEKIRRISELSDRIARIELFHRDSLAEYSSVIEREKRALQTAEAELKQFTIDDRELRTTKEGISVSTFVAEWVTEIIQREKSLAELQVMEEVRRSLDNQYVYFSPIGTTISRMEREIGFTEHSYLSVLQSLNTALMRQKTLQMTAATFKPINPPLFPISPIRTARRLIVAATFLGTFFLVLGYFILLEFFDRTVRDKNRAERLIPAKVLGAFPARNKVRYRSFNAEQERIATNYLANSLVPYLNPHFRTDIINFISTDSQAGKSLLIEQLKEYWTDRGLRVRVISWNEDMDEKTREYILTNNLSEIYDFDNEDVVLVEHNSLRKSAIPVGLLQEASLNLVVTRADKVWRDIDKIAFDRLLEQTKDAPVKLYLTNTKRDVAENFLGMLPPYTKLRTTMYKLIQFGLTSK